MKKNIVGIGVLLETPTETFLFQERDKNLKRNPGRIAPFGGGMDLNEGPLQCAIRELSEELELEIQKEDLLEIGVFESHYTKQTFIQIYLLKNIVSDNLTLHEGESIVELSLEDALQNELVTDFTKEVLRSLVSNGA